jgi:microcystin-dependent protein
VADNFNVLDWNAPQVATQAEAEAGTGTAARTWTPERIAQAIAAQAGEGGGITLEEALEGVYPVGCIYTSVVSTNPATVFGIGTWEAFGAGRVLVGLDSGQTEFDTAEETGGAKTHTLTSAEMPAHTHTQDAHTHTQNAHTHTQDAHSHIITSQTATTGGATSYEHGTLDTSSAEAEATETTATAVAVNQNATAVNQNATATNQNTGGGGAHNNLQPYIIVHFWKRVS